MFRKYQHIEKFGTTEVEGIEYGTCYIFPKIDGTNGSVWLSNGEIKAGSRRRELTEEEDNADFYKTVEIDQRIIKFLYAHPELRLFGEWLVPHSLKTYREDAWRRFYVFDVCTDKKEVTHEGEAWLEYLHYKDYQPLLDEFSIDYIPPLRIVRNGNFETFVKLLDENNFLIKDGSGMGEGIVIKNYEYKNKYGRQTWAKMVTSEFKEKHHKELGAPEVDGKELPEDKMIAEFCTGHLIKKTYEKIKLENDGWSSKYIPQLLGRVWHDFITEEIWSAIKKLKNPTINFKTLLYKTNLKVKAVLPELF